MVAHAVTQDFNAKERHKIIIESIDGLREIRQLGGLSLTARAALEALERIHARVTWNRYAVITQEEIQRPLSIAQAAIASASKSGAARCVR
ncbi:MAG: hypothetical protein V4719_00725 [Planctomycetota bacterium]